MIQQIADGQYPERFKFLPDFCSHAFQYGNIGVKNIQIATPLSFHSVSKTAVSPGNGMRPRSNILIRKFAESDSFPFCAARRVGYDNAFRFKTVSDLVCAGEILFLFRLSALRKKRFDPSRLGVGSLIPGLVCQPVSLFQQVQGQN